MRPRILLVPEFTDLTWTIKPLLEEWAEVASYELPGVGEEPLPRGNPRELTREVVVDRGLEVVDEHGWDRFFVAADGWATGTAIALAQTRPGSIEGLAFGHATLSQRRHGDRPPINPEVYDAMDQLIRSDAEAFIRHGIVQTTKGGVSEDLAAKMVERFPKDLVVVGWEVVTAEGDDIEDDLRALGLPLLLGKHEGCLMTTDEGYEDAVTAFPEARRVATEDPCDADPAFAEALREFCEEVLAAPR